MILTWTRMIIIPVSQRKQAIAMILFWFLCTRKANNFATSMVTAFTMYLLWSVDPSVINDPSTNMRFLQTAKRVSHFFKTLFYSFILQYFMFLLILFTLHVARSSFVHLWHAISSIKKSAKRSGEEIKHCRHNRSCELATLPQPAGTSADTIRLLPRHTEAVYSPRLYPCLFNWLHNCGDWSCQNWHAMDQIANMAVIVHGKRVASGVGTQRL